MKLVIPGKTFLVGEYAVLIGGSALGIATAPYFESLDAPSRIHPESAAGLFLKNELSAFSLKNTYQVGGFGFSTAEFILAWFKKNDVNSINRDVIQKIFLEYRALYDESEYLKKIKPSGADLIIQLLGGITYFNGNGVKSSSSDWAFSKIGFDIISTGLKIPTHEHLSQLNLQSLKDFPHFSTEVIQSYVQQDQEAFFENLMAWKKLLYVEGLQHNTSTEIAAEIEKCQEVILAKPNGAMGADTITVFYRIENQEQVRLHLDKLKLLKMANYNFISSGAHYVD